MRRHRIPTDWYGLRDEIEAALRGCAGFPPSVAVDGRLKRLPSGLNHTNYAFGIVGHGLTAEQSDAVFILRKLCPNEADDTPEEAHLRLLNEAKTLQALSRHTPPFLAPRFIALVGESADRPTGFIETAVEGISLEWLLKSEQAEPTLMERIARVAADVHRLPTGDFSHLPRHADACAHVLSELDSFDSEFLAEDPDASLAVEWIDRSA